MIHQEINAILKKMMIFVNYLRVYLNFSKRNISISGKDFLHEKLNYVSLRNLLLLTSQSAFS